MLTPDDLQKRKKEYQQDSIFFDEFFKEESALGGKGLNFSTDEAASGNAIMLARVALGSVITRRPDLQKRLRGGLVALGDFKPIRVKSMGSGNADLNVGVFLIGLSLSYDLLKAELSEDEIAPLRKCIVDQSEAFFTDVQNWRKVSFEQNHLIIPLCGLGMASMALLDEEPRAEAWGILVRNAVKHSFRLLSQDGWFFEGAWYWNFTLQYCLPYVVALKRNTGEDFTGYPIFKDLPLYLAHIYTPNPNFVFDFGDSSANIKTKGNFQTGWDKPWHTHPLYIYLAVPGLLNSIHPQPFLEDSIRFLSPVCTNGTFAKLPGPPPMTAIFQLATHTVFSTNSVPRPQRENFPPYHHFKDMDVLHWRQNWSDPKATALAFKSGPPAGHEFGAVIQRNEYPGWVPSLGHAHPDAGSFILFSKGVYLANDSGYLGKKESASHNCILVDGKGQYQGGTAWDTFASAPYSKYNKIRLENSWLTEEAAAAKAVYQDAYEDDLRLSKVERTLFSVGGRWVMIYDAIASEKEHRYEWLLHSDQAAKQNVAGVWSMENGPARLLIQPILKVEKAEVSETTVEAGCYGESIPQNRGHHLSLASSQAKEFEFLNLLTIQDIEQTSTVQVSGNKAKLEIGEKQDQVTCYLGNSPEFQGQYGYVWKKSDGTMTVGFLGKSLKTSEFSCEQKVEESLVIQRDQKGQWKKLKGSGDRPVELSMSGQSQTIR